MDWERLRERILEDIYPSEKERQETRSMYNKLSEFIQEEFGLETHFAGSASRGTGMTGNRDIDLFVLFPENTSRNELEEKGLKIGKKVFEKFNGDHRIEYAEHPYTKGDIDGREVEIVPCFDTSPENIKSSVDRTPHHSRWVQENLDDEQRKDVAILKKFLDTAEIYGSSLKTQGFSGYLCEILIAEYGGFKQLIETTEEWNEKQFIDPENHHEEVPETLKKKFRNESLIVIDPVDPERNVASVLSKQNYSDFIYHCWKFKQEPGMQFFQKTETNYTEFEVKQEIESRGDFLVIEFDNIDAVEDVVYPQMRKTVSRLEQKLRSEDFRIYESGFHIGNKTRIFFDIDRKLPETRIQEGPSVFHGEDHMAQFTSKYDNVYVKGERLVAKTEREYPDAKKFLQYFLKNDLEAKGIPTNIAEKMADYTFTEPVNNDKKWLNYLGKKLHVTTNNEDKQ